LQTLQSERAANVDTTNSLINRITAQRFYHANRLAIKPQHTVNQTLFSL
jgi:flagellar hook protein FlgE